jgi:hypothetical protein
MLDLNKHEAEELIARSRMTGLIMVALRAPALCVRMITLIRSDLTQSLGKLQAWTLRYPMLEYKHDAVAMS